MKKPYMGITRQPLDYKVLGSRKVGKLGPCNEELLRPKCTREFGTRVHKEE